MTAALGGWLAASVAGALALVVWRALAIRMEAVARACHELRGPLTAARLGLQLGDRVGELSPDRLRAIDLELGRAALALEDLGEMRAPRRPYKGPLASLADGSELVDLRELLSDSVQAWGPWAAERGAELQLRWSGATGLARGDRFRIAQATGNLIANAIEHGGGVVAVRGRVSGSTARIEVVDAGPGLPAPIAQLARRSQRGRAARGHGLAIALAVAELHGGRLAAAPSERGARLVLELPVAPSGDPAAG